MATFDQLTTARSESALSTNKVLRNTYTLLAMTLLFSTLTAGLSIALRVPPMIAFGSTIAAIVLLWFVLPRTANSAAGLGVVFAFTGLIGLGLGPTITYYLQMPKGPEIVMMSLGGTGMIFLGLSAYALTSRKDFSFMGGMLASGILVAFLAGIVGAIFDFPVLSLAVSAMFVLLMSGLILFQTSQIIHGGETNYILATTTLFVSILNLFTSLLHLLGAFSGND